MAKPLDKRTAGCRYWVAPNMDLVKAKYSPDKIRYRRLLRLCIKRMAKQEQREVMS